MIPAKQQYHKSCRSSSSASPVNNKTKSKEELKRITEAYSFRTVEFNHLYDAVTVYRTMIAQVVSEANQ